MLQTTHLFHARLSWTEPDRMIGWRFTPGREYWFFAENDHAITGRINSMGWRDRERTVRKPAGTYRIAVVGDSFVEAFQVEPESTFVARAEERLNRERPESTDITYEVMNFGRSGMSPAEEMMVLERDVMPCDPDAVVLLFTPQNDIADIDPSTTTDSCRPFFHQAGLDSLSLDTSFAHRRDFWIRELINPFKQHSALVSLVSERYNAWRLMRARARSAPAAAPDLTREQDMCTAHPDEPFTRNYGLCKLLITRMARDAAARGVRFELASVPLVYEDQVVERLRLIDPSFDPGFFDRDLAVMADSSGFGFVPLTAAFAATARATGNRLHWQHWNYEGHREAAEVLFLVPWPSAREPSASH